MEDGQSDVSQASALPEQSSPVHPPPFEHLTNPDNVFGGGDPGPSSSPIDAADAVAVASADYSSVPENVFGGGEHDPSVTSTDAVYAADYAAKNVMGRGEHVPAVFATDGAFATPDPSNPTVSGDTGETKPENLAMDAGVTVAGPENVLAPPAEAVSYGAMNINGSSAEMMSYQSAGVVENGGMAGDVGDVGGMVVEQQFEEVYSLEEERLWNLVRGNCLDFDAWTALIDETEKVSESNIMKIRKVYDAFLGEFPLCFGYWKKYADHEGRLDSVDKVVEVYERAVLAVTYSVDIWLHYCVFTISTYEDPDIIRRLFERGLAYVGTDYLSYPLWDEYIRYEESHHEWSHLSIIYTRILENPIQQLDRYFNCFKELAASRPLSEIRTAEEAIMMAATLDSGPEGIEGEVRPDDVEQSCKPVSAGLTEPEELEKYIAIREEMYKKAKEFDSKIIGFETAIRRPYFHVKPLDDPELDNWHNYLDFIERGDDFNKVVKLYERCLIACANYSECWIRYVLCMKASGSMELALNALARATQVFVKKQPEIHLFAARFKERNGDVDGARADYQLIYSEISPFLLEAIVKHANMEYRLGDKEAATSVYEKLIAAEQGKEHSQILPLLLVQYSRFLSLVVGDAQKAREILYESLGHMQVSKPLLEAVIHLESIHPSPKNAEYLDSLVEKYITPNSDGLITASTTDREEISCIFLEFLDLFGDAQSIEKADNRHNILFLRQKSMSVSKKRHADDYLASDKAKMIKSDTSGPTSGQSVMGAYPNAQNQWPAGYAQKAPTWSQTSQAQGQQWNAGYTQQGGYSAYGGYANYNTPQMPAPTTPSATYAYPPTYPAQAYPQQTYAQPATSYPQQQAAGPQAYYTGYY